MVKWSILGSVIWLLFNKLKGPPSCSDGGVPLSVYLILGLLSHALEQLALLRILGLGDHVFERLGGVIVLVLLADLLGLLLLDLQEGVVLVVLDVEGGQVDLCIVEDKVDLGVRHTEVVVPVRGDHLHRGDESPACHEKHADCEGAVGPVGTRRVDDGLRVGQGDLALDLRALGLVVRAGDQELRHEVVTDGDDLFAERSDHVAALFPLHAVGVELEKDLEEILAELRAAGGLEVGLIALPVELIIDLGHWISSRMKWNSVRSFGSFR